MSSTPSDIAVASGARWSGVGAGLGSAVELLRLAVVAALLPPGEIGLAAFALLLVQFAIFIQDAGIGQALVRQRDVDSLTYSSVFWLNLLYGGLLALLVFFLARPLDAVFTIPGLEPLIRIAALLFFFSALGEIQRFLLLRDLRYKALALAEFAGLVIGSTVTIGFAIVEPTAHAMIVGRLIQTAATTFLIAALVYQRYRLRPWFSWRAVRPLYSFGIFVSLDRIFLYFANQADRLFIGSFLDIDILGVYHVASNLTSMKARTVGAIIFRVVYPAMSKRQREDGGAAEILTQTHRFILVFMITPLLVAAVLAGFATPLLPADWQPALPLVQILVFAAILVLLRAPTRALMLTYDMARDVFVIGLAGNILLVVGAFVSARWFDVYAIAGVLVLAELLRLALMLFWMEWKAEFKRTPALRWTWWTTAGVLTLAVAAQGLSMWPHTAGLPVLFLLALMVGAILATHGRTVVQVLARAIEPLAPKVRARRGLDGS